MLFRGYESGNILAVEYLLGNLPDDGELETDLTRLLLLRPGRAPRSAPDAAENYIETHCMKS